MTEEIIGSVDYVERNRVFHGWAFCAGLVDNTTLCIQVRDGSRVVAHGHPSNLREDLNGITSQPAGYVLEADVQLDAYALFRQQVTVHALCNGVEVVLSYHSSALDETKRGLLSELLHSETPFSPADRPERLSPLYFAVGQLSRDGSMRLGREGTLFLTKGSNHVSELYSRSQQNVASATDLAAGWLRVFRQRECLMESIGAKYIQLVIPEKQTVQNRLYDQEITVPSPALELLEEEALRALPGSYLSALFALRSAEDELRTYRQNDLHLSTQGAKAVSSLIAAHLGLEPPKINNYVRVVREGDVGLKFLDAPAWEVCVEAEDLVGVSPPVLVKEFTPPQGKHIGRSLVFLNQTAPSSLKVVCFGNSFFERGHTSSVLTWWAARLFSEFHFIWHPAMSAAYLRSVKPDVVIGQTIERFLTLIPHDDLSDEC